MSQDFRGYDNLMPDEHDLGRDWSKLPTHLPPASRDLLVPFDFAPDRQPDKPTIITPDGWITEARDELKDGMAIRCHLPVFGMDAAIARCRLLCRGAKHHRDECPIQVTVQRVITEFFGEMQRRTRLRLALRYDGPGLPKYPIVFEDGDGIRRPEVQFVLAPVESDSASRSTGPNAALSPRG